MAERLPRRALLNPELVTSNPERAVDYADWTADDLLGALELAGRKPDPDLLRACLARREEITPGLLDMLLEGVDDSWADSDPRYYRDIHAGLMLIEFREEKALPIFDEIFRDPDREDPLREWFQSQLPKYGAAAVPWLIKLAQDPAALHWSRITAQAILSDIGQLFPEERARVLDSLRGMLPSVREDGSLDLPAAPEAIDDDQVEFWTFVVSELMDFRDPESQAQVLTLYEADLLDEWIIGDRNAYLKEVTSQEKRYAGVAPPDLISYYHKVPEDRGEDLPDPDEMDQVIDQIAEDEGFSEEEVLDLLDSLAGLQGRGRDLGDGPFGADEPFRLYEPPLPFHAEKKPGRNEPCPCGSGKKYKHCHGKGS